MKALGASSWAVVGGTNLVEIAGDDLVKPYSGLKLGPTDEQVGVTSPQYRPLRSRRRWRCNRGIDYTLSQYQDIDQIKAEDEGCVENQGWTTA